MTELETQLLSASKQLEQVQQQRQKELELVKERQRSYDGPTLGKGGPSGPW